MQLTDLPFIKDVKLSDNPKGRKTERIFWQVAPTGDFSKDGLTGTQYAREFLNYAQKEGHCPLVSIVKDMPREFSGIEIGFLSVIGTISQVGMVIGDSILEREISFQEEIGNLPKDTKDVHAAYTQAQDHAKEKVPLRLAS
ncbi:MAG TPA: hypothetical protein PLE43_02965 [Alphaproteobacteria bacterium]|nr:hypothetical protein [Alphaproteobacteria bacterium]